MAIDQLNDQQTQALMADVIRPQLRMKLRVPQLYDDHIYMDTVWGSLLLLRSGEPTFDFRELGNE